MATLDANTIDLPKAHPKWDELSAENGLIKLKEYFQAAVVIELYTIPLYLFAAYSIVVPDDPNSHETKAFKDIIGE